MKEILTMTPVEEAARRLLAAFKPLRKVEEVPLRKALGRQAAQDIRARAQIPNFNRSTKDGYAVRIEDVAGASQDRPARLSLVGQVDMGEKAGLHVGPGQAVAIPTGGMVPKGASGVVMLEYCQGPGQGFIQVETPLEDQENIVAAGADVEVGDLLIREGKRLRPQELGLLAGQGICKLKVLEKIKVAVLSTGNEIVNPESEPAPGEVRDINSYILEAEIAISHAEPRLYPVARDDYQALRDLVLEAYEENHMVLISGGSSVGERDYCLDVLKEISGQDPLFHGIPLKPGKPALGAAKEGKVLVGLPGHPVSSRTVFDVLVRPLLQTPIERTWKKTVEGVLAAPVHAEKERHDHIKVYLEKAQGQLLVHPLVGVSSIVSLLTEGEGEIVVEKGQDYLEKGSRVKVFLY